MSHLVANRIRMHAGQHTHVHTGAARWRSGNERAHCTCRYRCAHARVQDEAALRRRPAHARWSAHARAHRQRGAQRDGEAGTSAAAGLPCKPAALHLQVPACTLCSRTRSSRGGAPTSPCARTPVSTRTCAPAARGAARWRSGNERDGAPPVQARRTAPACTVLLTHAFETRRCSAVALRIHAR